jgi:hypothetical protein
MNEAAEPISPGAARAVSSASLLNGRLLEGDEPFRSTTSPRPLGAPATPRPAGETTSPASALGRGFDLARSCLPEPRAARARCSAVFRRASRRNALSGPSGGKTIRGYDTTSTEVRPFGCPPFLRPAPSTGGVLRESNPGRQNDTMGV